MKEIDKNLADAVALKILDIMKKTADKTINSSNVEVYHNGIVRDVYDDGTAHVELSFGSFLTISNLSGQALTVNDRVKIYSDKQNSANAYIGLKY